MKKLVQVILWGRRILTMPDLGTICQRAAGATVELLRAEFIHTLLSVQVPDN